MVKELSVKVISGMILPLLTTTADFNDDDFLNSCLLSGLPMLQGHYILHVCVATN